MWKVGDLTSEVFRDGQISNVFRFPAIRETSLVTAGLTGWVWFIMNSALHLADQTGSICSLSSVARGRNCQPPASGGGLWAAAPAALCVLECMGLAGGVTEWFTWGLPGYALWAWAERGSSLPLLKIQSSGLVL